MIEFGTGSVTYSMDSHSNKSVEGSNGEEQRNEDKRSGHWVVRVTDNVKKGMQPRNHMIVPTRSPQFGSSQRCIRWPDKTSQMVLHGAMNNRASRWHLPRMGRNAAQDTLSMAQGALPASPDSTAIVTRSRSSVLSKLCLGLSRASPRLGLVVALLKVADFEAAVAVAEAMSAVLIPMAISIAV